MTRTRSNRAQTTAAEPVTDEQAPEPTEPTTEQGAEPMTEPTAAAEPVTDEQSTDEPTEPTDAEQSTDAEPEPTADEPNAADTFCTAYGAAIDAGRDGSGAVPAEAMDAVVTAYRALRGAVRSNLPNAVSTAALGAAMDAEPIDVHALAAVRSIGAAIAAAGTARTERAEPTDPRAIAADALAVLAAATAVVLGAFAADERDGLTAAAAERGADAGRVLAAIRGAHGKRAAASTPSASGSASGGKQATGAIASHVAAAIAAAEPGAVLTVAAIRAFGSEHYAPGTVSAGAVTNAIRRGVAGVTATRTDAGTLAATAATDAEPEPAATA